MSCTHSKAHSTGQSGSAEEERTLAEMCVPSAFSLAFDALLRKIDLYVSLAFRLLHAEPDTWYTANQPGHLLGATTWHGSCAARRQRAAAAAAGRYTSCRLLPALAAFATWYGTAPFGNELSRCASVYLLRFGGAPAIAPPQAGAVGVSTTPVQLPHSHKDHSHSPTRRQSPRTTAESGIGIGRTVAD